MKKSVLIGFLFTCIFAKLASQTGNPVVVIAPFEAQGISENETNVITEMFTAEYATTGLANVVDRNSFDKIKKELSFQASDWSNSDKVAELGKALNANQVVVGAVTSFRGQVIVSIKVIDINSTTILASYVEKLKEIDGMVDRMPKICKTLANKAKNASKNSSSKANNKRDSATQSEEEKHTFYIAPILGYDSFIIGNTCSIGVDFKYKHKTGFSVWTNNAVLLGTSKHKVFKRKFSEDFGSNGELWRVTEERNGTDYKRFFTAGVSTEVMLGYSKVFGGHSIGIGAGYQGAITKRFFEAYAFAFRFEYSYMPQERNVGFIMAITDGIGFIRHKEKTDTVTDNAKRSNYSPHSSYYIRHDMAIIKNVSANNRFSLKLGIVFTP